MKKIYISLTILQILLNLFLLMRVHDDGSRIEHLYSITGELREQSRIDYRILKEDIAKAEENCRKYAITCACVVEEHTGNYINETLIPALKTLENLN